MAQPPQLQVARGGHAINPPQLEPFRENHPETPRTGRRAVAAEPGEFLRQTRVVTSRLDFHECFVRAAFFFQVGKVNDSAFLQDQHLFAGFLDVAQQMGAQ